MQDTTVKTQMQNAKYQVENTIKRIASLKIQNIVGQCKRDKVMVSKDDRLRNSLVSPTFTVRTSRDVGRLRHMVIVTLNCIDVVAIQIRAAEQKIKKVAQLPELS